MFGTFHQSKTQSLYISHSDILTLIAIDIQLRNYNLLVPWLLVLDFGLQFLQSLLAVCLLIMIKVFI